MKVNRNNIKIIVLLLAVGFLVYFDSLANKFVFDDKGIILNNPSIREIRFIGRIFTQDLMGQEVGKASNYYRPLQMTSYVVDYHFWKFNYIGYHITNIFLHSVVAILVFFLIALIFNDSILALITSLLFIVHPIHTEAVAYISGRSEPLVSIFLLSSFIFFIKHENNKGVKSVLFYLGSIFLFCSGLLSKEMAAIFPFILIFYGFYYRKVYRLRKYIPFLIILALYVLLRFRVLGFYNQFLTAGYDFYARSIAFFKSLIVYVWLIFVPTSLYMQHKLSGGIMFDFCILIFSAFIVIAIILFRRVILKERIIIFGLVWFLIFFIPQSNLVPLSVTEYIAEHFVYLPSVGIFLILAYLIRKLIMNKPHLGRLAIILIIGFYGLLTVNQNSYWKDDLTLFGWMLKNDPANNAARNNLGIAYKNKKMYKQAIGEFQKAIALDTNHLYARCNLAETYMNAGSFEQALKAYQDVLKVKLPLRPPIILGELALTHKDIDRFRPTLANTYNNLGFLYARKSDYKRAEEYWQKALVFQPDFKPALDNLKELPESK